MPSSQLRVPSLKKGIKDEEKRASIEHKMIPYFIAQTKPLLLISTEVLQQNSAHNFNSDISS